MDTKPTTQKEIKRTWKLFDAKGQILGRLSTQIALFLTGKNKPYFARNMDCGNFAVVINAKEVQVSGQKEDKKSYKNHSGYPGGFNSRTVSRVRRENPTEIVKRAVMGMLPNNKLRDRWMTRLYIYEAERHPYSNKLSKAEA